MAYDHGVAGVVLSNHGGRQLDFARSGIEVLVEVVAKMKEHVPGMTFPNEKCTSTNHHLLESQKADSVNSPAIRRRRRKKGNRRLEGRCTRREWSRNWQTVPLRLFGLRTRRR